LFKTVFTKKDKGVFMVRTGVGVGFGALCAAFSMSVIAGEAMPAAVKLVAHRGEAHDAPENTMAAFELAAQRGVDGIEFDLHLSADGEIMVAHDADTARMSGQKLVMAKTSSEELRRLDVGSKKNSAFAGEKIPFFRELAVFRQPGRPLYAEIKCGPEIIPVLQREIEALKLEPEELLFISFKADVVAAVRRELPRYKAYLLVGLKFKDGNVVPTAAELIETLGKIDATGADVKGIRELDKEYFDRIKAAGFEFHVWTIDDPGTARKFAGWGVDSITSNRAGWLKTVLATPEK
jgi:glycerophosphoryl diester phosphodiesterase